MVAKAPPDDNTTLIDVKATNLTMREKRWHSDCKTSAKLLQSNIKRKTQKCDTTFLNSTPWA
jgi:hypothetical protein